MPFGGNLHSSTVVIISATEPPSPNVGLIWQNSDNGVIKIYDGTIFTEVPDLIARESFQSGDQQVYPHSTTIGDYTKPILAKANSQIVNMSTKLQGTWTTTPASVQNAVDNDKNIATTFGRNANGKSGQFNYDLKTKFIGGNTLDIKFGHKKTVGTAVSYKITLMFSNNGTDWIFDQNLFNGNGSTTEAILDLIAVVPNNLAQHYAIFPNTPFTEHDAECRVFEVTKTGVTNVTGDGSDENAVDDSLSTRWESKSVVNPNIFVDMGSVQDVVEIALHMNALTTETEILIQVSNDTISWTTLRTILVSNLVNGAYNFIRFNRQIVDQRYLRIFGNSGSALVLSINQIKVLQPSDVISRHGHLGISVSDNSLNLDATAS